MIIMDSKVKETGIRILAIVGLAAILGIAALVVVRTYHYLPPIAERAYSAVVSFSSIFRPGEKLVLESSKLNISSGEAFTLTWTKSGKTEGSYSLSYPCKKGMSLSVSGGTNQKVACDSPFAITSEKNSASLKAFSTENRFTDTKITLTFTPKDSKESAIVASVLMLVNNTSIASNSTTTTAVKPPVKTTPITKTSSTSSSTTTTVAGTKTEKTYPINTGGTTNTQTGSTDLVPTILETGIIDKLTNSFIATTTLRAYDRIAVRFEIANKGGRATGGWYFSAVLPTYPSYIFQSDGQQSLEPGDKIEFVIGFDHVQGADNNVVTINADPTQPLSEANETNNIVKTTINGVKF